MRRFYQESWQGIPFTAFSHLSFFHLAEPRFYSVFYEELFRRYKDWHDLPAAWRANKTLGAQWLANRIMAIPLHGQSCAASAAPCVPKQVDIAACANTGKNDDASISDSRSQAMPRVLSIGSGVGYMEKMLLENMPGLDLHVNEPSTVGMRWLRRIIPAERIYIGLPPACLPPDIQFNCIYLSAVDYGIPSRELVRLVDALQAQLAPGGEIICLSASLLEEDTIIGSLVNAMKNVIRCGLHYMGVRRQQFWGWRRTQKEYRALFTGAAFAETEDGTLSDGFDTYYIIGRKALPNAASAYPDGKDDNSDISNPGQE